MSSTQKPRPRTRAMTITVGLIPFVVALFVAILLLMAGSKQPGKALFAFFVMPFSNSFYLGNMIDQASLILLCALGFLLTWKVGVFNLGGEGQAYLSALVAVEIAISLPGIAGPFGLLIAIIAACAIAGALGVLVGILREKLGISELITSFLTSAAIAPLIDFAISGPLRDARQNFLSTPVPEPGYFLPNFLPPSALSVGIIVAPVCACVLYFVLKRTRFGYELRLVGDNREFASSQSVKSTGLVIGSLGIGSAFYGLSGALTVFASRHTAFVGLTSGLGWNGIAAALIGRGHPFGAVAGALVFAYISAGSKAAMIYTDFTFELGTVIQGVVFLLVTLRFVRKRKMA